MRQGCLYGRKPFAKGTVINMATIGDVAKKAGVSTTLVSRYLNGVKGVSHASKEKIEAAIRELQYVPDESARMLVRRRGGGTPSPEPSVQSMPPAIAVVCEDVDFALISPLYLGIKRALWESENRKGHQLLLFSALPGEKRDEDEEMTFGYIRRACKGLLCFGGRETRLTQRLREISLPSVLVVPHSGSKTLHIAARDFRKETEALEERSVSYVEMLFDKIAAGDATLTEVTIEYAFRLADENEERSPVGRRLQSHLL